MRLHRQAVEQYVLDITTTPAVVGAWHASFDNGATWKPGEADGDGWRWLLAGPDAPPDEDATVVNGTVFPLGRHTSDPEVIIRDELPRVEVYG